MPNKSAMDAANRARQAHKTHATDAAHRTREAYVRGVETNQRLREAWSNRESANAPRVADAGDQDWFDSRQVAADVDGWLESYNVYMDESPADEMDGEEGYEVEFRVMPNSTDDGDPETNAVLAGLDLIDLINLRDALQQEIDNYAISALQA